jgi:hypothetical protein
MELRSQSARKEDNRATSSGTPDQESESSISDFNLDDQSVTTVTSEDSGYSTDSMGIYQSNNVDPRIYMPEDAMIPQSDDEEYDILKVLNFRFHGGTACSKVGEEGEHGIRYAYFFDTESGYAIRTGDPNAKAPGKPSPPEPLVGKVPAEEERQFKRQDRIYKEYCRVETIVKEMIMEKFPKEALYIQDSRTGAFKTKHSPQYILDEIQKRVSSPMQLTKAYVKLTKEMQELEYIPCREGPVEYLKFMIIGLDRAKEISPESGLTMANIIPWMLTAFDRCNHNKINLGQCTSRWEEHYLKFTGDPADEEELFEYFRIFWILELSKLYRLEQQDKPTRRLSNSGQAQLVHQVNELNDEVTTLKAMQVAMYEQSRTIPPVVHAKTDQTEATIGTSLSAEIHSAFHGIQQQLQAQQVQLQALQLGQQAVTHVQTPRPEPWTPQGGKKWRQYKFWCWKCSVNLTHDSKDCKGSGKDHPNASRTTPQGGNMKRKNLWMKYHHRDVTEAQHKPVSPWS